MSPALAHKPSPAIKAKPTIQLGLPEFSRIKAAIAKDAGIEFSDDKVNLVHSRLQKRLKILRLTAFRDYCNLIESDAGHDERQFMLNALTTNVTRFFREPHHFKHLLKTALPPLITRAKAGERIRIWSGGCSSGQEPYSIAAVLMSLMPDAAKYDIKILASDIDRNMILTGRRGIYEASLMAHMPVKLRDKFFEAFDGPSGPSYVAKDNIKSIISFRELNLNAQFWPMKGKFDIIFCRNTVIYFNQSTQEKVWTRFKDHMTPGSYLYIGHSERISGPSIDEFTKADVTTYQLKRISN